MNIPWQEIEANTLSHLIQEFVLREGTDYGYDEITLDEKVDQIREQLKAGDAIITFSEQNETVDIKLKRHFR